MPISMPDGERLVVAARPRLMVVDQVEHAMAHQRPVAAHQVQAAMRADVSGCQAVPEASRAIG